MVAERLETFLAAARGSGRSPPRFVEREFRRFLECGVLAHGFLRVRCDACRSERLVPFSCKGRGFCSSCGGRRMADTAAHLVDRVLPEAPVRQWVLSLPFRLRYRMAYDARLTADVLRIFVRRVFASLRRRARRRLRPAGATAERAADLRCGAVTFVQRFGGALNLNVHFHTLVLDGVLHRTGDRLRFRPLPPPDGREVARVAESVARAIGRLLQRRGLGATADPEESDPLVREEPLLAALASASTAGRVAMGSRAGQRAFRFGDHVDVDDLPARAGRRCASVGGLSIHADVAVPARDRRRLERLCRYAARPALALERLSLLPDGRLVYRLKQRWRDGTTHVGFEPLELMERLASLVPPPRFNLVRYHGVLAPAARDRARVVETVPQPQTFRPERSGQHGQHRQPCSGCVGNENENDAGRHVEKPVRELPRPDGRAAGAGIPSTATPPRHPLRPRNCSWAELMRRVFEVDVLECPACHGRMRILAAIHPPEATVAILECLGLPTRAPPIAPAMVPARTDSELDF
ncbi:MAG TPA: transposase, partial [Candidatus Polarisedimenticolaceae bacterium]|nr:transposase [Candidatus Polarisedimenticolaceae bacterium]